MAKRKIDCDLDDIVMEYTKKVKCQKTLKLFGTECSGKNDPSKTLQKFIKFLVQKEKKKENRVKDDLGFEINFGAFQPETKVCFLRILKLNKSGHYFKLPLKESRKVLTEKTKPGTRKETTKRKTDIPKDFIKKIKNLGMKVEDAEVLFKSKIDWTAIYSENKIYCVEPGCNYFTRIDNGELTSHMIDMHKYGDYPCDYDHCDYVAASKVKKM